MKKVFRKLLAVIIVVTMGLSSAHPAMAAYDAVTPSGACLTCAPNNCASPGRITLNFPGMQNMTVQYWTNSWQTLAGGPFDDNAVFCATGATSVRVVRPGLVFNYDVTVGGEYTINAPVVPLYVRGVPVSGNTLGVVGGGFGSNWVYNGVPACETYGNSFTVFNNRTDGYEVRLSRPGFFPLSRRTSMGSDNGYEYLYVDFSAYFAYITVPQGVSNVRMQSNGWIVNAAQENNTIWLLVDHPNYREAIVTFDYCCLVQHRVDFLLDGHNPLVITCDYCDCDCTLCPGCDECQICSVCLPFIWRKYNGAGNPGISGYPFNQSLYNGGMIRVWTYRHQWLANHPSPHYGYGPEPIFVRVISAHLETQDGRCAIELGLAGDYTDSHFTVRFGAPLPYRTPEHNGFSWTTMHIYVETICGETEWVVLANNFNPCDCDFACGCPDCLWPVCGDPCLDCGNICTTCHDCPGFRFDIFNNGSGGSPSRPNPGLASSGTIRMWTGFGPVAPGDNTPLRLPLADSVTAVDQEGNCAMDLVTINQMWGGPGLGWVDYFNFIDVNKNATWERIYLTIIVCGEPHTAVLVNSRLFSLNIFNNGPDGSPSTPNPSLAAAGTIRMWTRLGGVNAPIPRSAENTIVATFADTGECALHLVLLRPIVGDNVTTIDVDRNVPWEFINFSITVFGQTVNVLLHNDTSFVADQTVIVSFEPGDGTGTMADVHVPVGEDFTLPASGFTAPAGYEFYGWFVTGYADPGGTLHPGDDIKVGLWPNTTVTVTALWLAIPDPNEWTVTFVLNGGVLDSGELIQAVLNGENAVPPVVSRLGYTFAGWTPLTGYTNVTDNVTLTAQWESEPFSIVISSVVGEDGSYTAVVNITGIPDFTGHVLRVVRTPGGMYGGITDGVQAATTQIIYFCELVNGITVSLWCPNGTLLGFDTWVR